MHRQFEIGCALCLCLLAYRAKPAAAEPQKDPRSIQERLFYFDIAGARLRNSPEKLADVLGNEIWALVYYALPPSAVSDSFKQFLQTAEKTRVDKQVGSSATAGGSTSTVSKTGLVELLGFALESGAVSPTIEQNVVTLRANADGLVRFASNQEIFPACGPSDPDCAAPGPLKDLELSAAFNVSDAGTKTFKGTAPTTGGSVDFSAVLQRRPFGSATVRYAVDNNRDLRSKKYRENWLKWFQSNRSQLAAAGRDLLGFVNSVLLRVQQQVAVGGNLDVYTQWFQETQQALKQSRSDQDVQETLQRRLDVLLEKMQSLDPEFDNRLQDLANAYFRYFALRRGLASTLITDPAWTLEYTYSQPMLQPNLHTVKVAYAFSPRGTPGAANPGTISFNAGLDFYRESQPAGTSLNTSRWKDAQAAVQFDRPLGPADSPAQLSLGAYYQYQIHPGILTIPSGATALPGTNSTLPPNGSQLLTQRGSIFAAQAILTVRIPASGLKVPVGISWSNRTELVKGNDVRGHVGFTFDSSPLFLLPGLR